VKALAWEWTQELYNRVKWAIAEYDQPALVEEYLPGREFTVGVMGRADAALYSRHPELYEKDGFHRFPVLEVETSKSVTPGVYGIAAKKLDYGSAGIPDFLCPAPIPSALSHQMQNLAIRAHKAVSALDVSRVDMRLDCEGKPRLLEINSLPGLTPDFSDLCVVAKASGLTYTDLILEILYLGASRFDMLTARNPVQLRAPIRLNLRRQARVQAAANL
jgi:D-alanine-D-alanine ligase-like ATP-grasp enzyme